MTDKVKVEGILKEGYGISPKLVMRDKDLSVEAKAIYAYMSSFAGNGETAFPKVSTACRDLNMSEDRFRKHRDQLIEKGYITIIQNRKKGKFNNNVYVINQIITVPLKHGDGEKPTRQNEGTNNNSSFNNNNINSSSNAFAFYQENFGVLSPFVAENIEHWIGDLNEELVIEAMKLALKANKKFNYAEGILKDWLSNNVKTLDDVKAKEVEFKNRKPSGGKSSRKVARF